MAKQRGNEGSRTPPFTPSPEWIEAFHEQSETPEFIEASRRYARGRAALVALVRNIDVQAYADELLQNVIDDTLFGRLTWDPARVDFKKHVLDAMQSRSRHAYVRGNEFKHLPLEGRGLIATERALADRQAAQSEREETSRRWNLVLAAMRTLAADDPDVLLVLDAYEAELTKRVHVLRFTGLTPLRYDAARQRLLRLRDQLPHHLVPRSR